MKKMKISEKNYVNKAEQVIIQLSNKVDKRGKKVDIATTTQIRNLLAMSADIYNCVILLKSDKLTDDIVSKIEYLKIRMVYEAGRDEKVKSLIETAELLDCINEINGSKKNFILFNHYMEAIVAYRKYLGGKEKE